VCPDSANVMVRHLLTVTVSEKTGYLHGEAERAAIVDIVDSANS
jgi:hypothetical protein